MNNITSKINQTDSQLAALKEIELNTFVMGDDRKSKFDFLQKENCEVVSLPRAPEISTTRIKEDLK